MQPLLYIQLNMQLVLQNIIPVPLKEKLLQRSSSIWNKQLLFKKGEWIKINAPSGSGKTTFIHTLYKLRNDYEGTVQYDEKDIRQINANDLAVYRQQKISIVFQDLRLFPNITARENIELNRVMQTPLYEENKIDEMAEIVGVAGILQQRAGLCSYGEQQRIAIIRALIQPFDWLLMDEPFSHLDKDNIAKAAALIAAECTKRNAGFILTDLDDDAHFNYSNRLQL